MPEIYSIHIDFRSMRVSMLGVKPTLKDRWQHVHSEAVRIETKHLLARKLGTSENQTDEMQIKKLQLELPRQLHSTFRLLQQAWLMNLADFLKLLN